MTPLPTNPNAVALVGTKGEILEVASNIDADFQIKLVKTRDEFRTEAANKPFRTDRPPQEPQVLSSAASKARYATKT
jgi:hypothetical protein